jgi:hypothetical protein
LKLSLDHLLPHLFVERQGSHDFFQPHILRFKLPEPPHLRWHQTGYFFFQLKKSLADPYLPAPIFLLLMTHAFRVSENSDALIAPFRPSPVKPTEISNRKRGSFWGADQPAYLYFFQFRYCPFKRTRIVSPAVV